LRLVSRTSKSARCNVTNSDPSQERGTLPFLRRQVRYNIGSFKPHRHRLAQRTWHVVSLEEELLGEACNGAAMRERLEGNRPVRKRRMAAETTYRIKAAGHPDSQ